MIISIESTLPTFKTVRFRPGLNILLAAKAPGSNDRQTRNSAGKTSLIDIIHFLLGGKADPDNLMRHKELNEYAFRGTFRIAGRDVVVERSGAKHGRVYLDEASATQFGLRLKVDKDRGKGSISNEEWKDFLAHQFFGFPSDVEGSEFGDSFTPSFRALFGYFARRRGSGGLLIPEKQATAQQPWDWQVNLSFLLGLDWRLPRSLHLVRQRESALAEFRKAAKGGAFGSVIGTVAELRPAVVRAEANANKLRQDLQRFEVHEAYADLMNQATKAKTEMQALGRRSVPLMDTLAHLRKAVDREVPPARDDVDRLYQAVGIELPDTAVRRFEDVEQFHRSVLENRRVRLFEEIETLERELARGEMRIAELDAKRSELLRVLEGRGALEDFIALQKRVSEADVEAASLRERYKAAETLESESTELRLERIGIKRRLQEDHEIRHEQIDKAILMIGDAIGDLYEDRQGKFEVEATENGPAFRVMIQGHRGGGISNMEIFCLDHALFSMWTSRRKGPGFLIHDSHLFDGVDTRQAANAIRLGAATAEAHKAQYIVTLNSDVFESLPFPDDFIEETAIIQPRLSDENEGSGLFGFRFD